MHRYAIIAIVTALSLNACKRYRPMDSEVLSAPQSRYLQDTASCDKARHLVPVTGSLLQWEAVKYKVESGEETRLVGTNSVDGIWKIWDNDIQKSTGEFQFDAASTNSEDALRDDRIMYVVFGLAQRAPFQFTINSLQAIIPTAATASTPGATMDQELMASGLLEVFGQKARINFPVIIKEQGSNLTLTPKGLIQLNIRPRGSESNGINLASQVERVLTYVTGVAMRDEVSIDFSLRLKNICPQKS